MSDELELTGLEAEVEAGDADEFDDVDDADNFEDDGDIEESDDDDGEFGLELITESLRTLTEKPFKVTFAGVTFVYVNSDKSILHLQQTRDGEAPISDDKLAELLDTLYEMWDAEPLIIRSKSFGFSTEGLEI